MYLLEHYLKNARRDVGKSYSFIEQKLSEKTPEKIEELRGKKFELKERALELLKIVEMDQALEGELLTQFKSEKTEPIQNVLWDIATMQSLGSFDDLALELVKSEKFRDIVLATRFAQKQDWLEEKKSSFVDQVFQRVEENLETYRKFLEFYEILNFLLQEGKEEFASEEINQALQRELSSCSNDNEDSRPKTDLTHVLSIAAQIPQKIEKEHLKSLMHLNLDGSRKTIPHYFLFQALSKDEIDEELDKISNFSQKVWLLYIVSQIEKTVKRLEILKDSLAINNAIGLPFLELDFPIRHMWDEILTILVNQLQLNFQPITYNTSFFFRIDKVVKDFIKREQAIQILKPALSKDCHEWSKQILQTWYEIGLRKKDKKGPTPVIKN